MCAKYEHCIFLKNISLVRKSKVKYKLGRLRTGPALKKSIEKAQSFGGGGYCSRFSFNLTLINFFDHICRQIFVISLYHIYTLNFVGAPPLTDFIRFTKVMVCY